eukprot:CAMPEP_0197681310 /NCGR_PEP_ID=MMETSP1338-20131121/94715_1 /TAXON_ID=43686 ORGANISM="Pelagodinium beii, Strain RCC1491" /NCGR_SAMPLE_ID=MMETSP1338 /ASSEMBLY_ACC=CAM_ASM_000754 /LENGTH=448 /DNA_ID=CAMNT_0043262629 /DNA_START=105 /DNA_END=1451 /DNA_ORIENTATION=+
MIGAGIFSLPIGLQYATPVPGLFILGCIGILSALSYWMVGYCCIVWEVDNFRSLWHRALGRESAWIIDVTIFSNGWFTLVGYLVLIGDFTTKSFEGLLGADHLLARNRLLDQWFITAVLLLPLSLAQDLKKLAFTSMLGLGVTVYVVLLVLQDSWLQSPPEWSPDVVLNRWGFGAFQAIALYTHAFVAHYNAPKLFAELERPTYSRWTAVVLVAYSVAFVVYASFAVAGLRRFEARLEGNVLKNYGPHMSVLLAWLGMGFSICFTYPLVFNSAREACVNLMTPVSDRIMSSPRLQDLLSSPLLGRRRGMRSGRSKSLVNVLGEKPGKKLSWCENTSITFVMVLLTAVVASFTSDVGRVNALAGAIMGTAVAFLFPSLLFYRTVLAQLRIMETSGLGQPLLGKDEKSPKVSHLRPQHRALMKASLVVACVIMAAGCCFGALGTVMALRA